MYFVLSPDNLSAHWIRKILADQINLNVMVGTMTSLLETLSRLYLLPKLETNFSKELKGQVIGSKNAFWSRSIGVDEANCLAQIEASLLHMLAALPIGRQLKSISNVESREQCYYNDLVRLHQSMGRLRPIEQARAEQWFVCDASQSLGAVNLVFIPELFHLDAWQSDLVDKLLLMNPLDETGNAIQKFLENALAVPVSIKNDLNDLSTRLFAKSLVKKASLPHNCRIIECRDNFQEAEIVVAMIQEALSKNVSLDDMAVVLPIGSDLLQSFPELLNRAGILTSNIHASKRIFAWDEQLIRDLLLYFRSSCVNDSIVVPMNLAAIVTNCLMPWSSSFGQGLADQVFKGKSPKDIVESFQTRGNTESIEMLEAIFKVKGEDWRSWLNGIVEKLHYPKDSRLFSKQNLVAVIESIFLQDDLYEGKSTVEKLDLVIAQIQPRSRLLENTTSRFVKNGLLLIKESEIQLNQVQHLFVMGFNQGAYEPGSSDVGVFPQSSWQKLTCPTGLDLDTSLINQQIFETCFRSIVSQVESSITFTFSEQDFNGESLNVSSSLLDIALCFQTLDSIAPEMLIQKVGEMDNPPPFLKQVDINSIKRTAPVEKQRTDLNLGQDLINLSTNSDGTVRPESPSSLERMMISPLAWLLNRQGLESNGWAIEELDILLKGTIAHKIFEYQFDGINKHSVNNFESMYQSAIEAEAEFLLLPQWRLERVQLKHEILKAIVPFIDWCTEKGWKISKTEEHLRGRLWDLELRGFADAVFENGNKRLVIDYKKSGSSDRVKRINSGFELQVLLYREMLHQQSNVEKNNIEGGYYTLNDTTLVLDTHASTNVEKIIQVELELSQHNQSAQSVSKIKNRIDQLRSGIVELNTDDDESFWKEYGIKTEYAFNDYPLVGLFMKSTPKQDGSD
ncbi:MAG: PD-(D/E)XK nuclease family protein [SAR324 cluster bacterium]|nr:PD-(D/E)XK nuclease family protein [SAR324 cluster bacterium]